MLQSAIIREAVASVALDKGEVGTHSAEDTPEVFLVISPPIWNHSAHAHILGNDDRPLCHSDIGPTKGWKREAVQELPRTGMCRNCTRFVGGKTVTIYPGEEIAGRQKIVLPAR